VYINFSFCKPSFIVLQNVLVLRCWGGVGWGGVGWGGH
jgi:hypothetical protein